MSDDTPAAKSRKSGNARAVGPSERESQAAVCDWWRSYCGTVRLDERVLMASASGAVLAGDAKKRAIQMNNLKRTGFRNGVPDLFLALPCAGADGSLVFGGLFIEMKKRDGVTSESQLQMIDLLRTRGYSVIVAWSCDEAIRAIEAYVKRAWMTK